MAVFGTIMCVWILIALFDARGREILGWDVVESEMWGESSIKVKYRGIVATQEQAYRNNQFWTMKQREDNFTSSRTAGRIYALITGFMRAPFLVIGFVVWLCWQPFRPLVAIVFAHPKSRKRQEMDDE